MNLKFLGTGSFFAKDNFHTNILLTLDDGYKMLIDSGTDLRLSLADAGEDVTDIDSVYISHLHGDHADLEYLAFAGRFIKNKKYHLIGVPSVLNGIKQKLMPGVSYLDDHYAGIEEFFYTQPICSSKFSLHDIEFNAIPMPHIDSRDENGKKKMIYSYGLSFDVNGTNIFITTDTFVNPSYELCSNEVLAAYDKADMIFHDCETFECSEVHCHYSQLKDLDNDMKSKIWLVHHQGKGNCDADAKRDGFAGMVEKGQEFEF